MRRRSSTWLDCQSIDYVGTLICFRVSEGKVFVLFGVMLFCFVKLSKMYILCGRKPAICLVLG